MRIKRLFVAGTDTDVGKTVASAVLMSALDADYWKPIQCGLEPRTDTEEVQRLTDFPSSRFHHEAYRLAAPMSPNQAAAREGVRIDLDEIQLPTDGPLVVEGAGGLLVPLNEKQMLIDLIARLGLPVVLVARSGLGTLNHTLLSLEALGNRNIPVAGLLLNGDEHPENAADLERIGAVPILGRLPLLATPDFQQLREGFFV